MFKRNKAVLPLDPDAVAPGKPKRPAYTHPGLISTVFLGGMVGTLARYAIDHAIPGSDTHFPLPTLCINLSGTFLLAVLLEVLQRLGGDKGYRRVIRLFIGTGVIATYTTYGSMVIEANLLTAHDSLLISAIYVFISIFGGLMTAFIGIKLVSMVGDKRS